MQIKVVIHPKTLEVKTIYRDFVQVYSFVRPDTKSFGYLGGNQHDKQP